jgi:hypothetical protein
MNRSCTHTHTITTRLVSVPIIGTVVPTPPKTLHTSSSQQPRNPLPIKKKGRPSTPTPRSVRTLPPLQHLTFFSFSSPPAAYPGQMSSSIVTVSKEAIRSRARRHKHKTQYAALLQQCASALQENDRLRIENEALRSRLELLTNATYLTAAEGHPPHDHPSGRGQTPPQPGEVLAVHLPPTMRPKIDIIHTDPADICMSSIYRRGKRHADADGAVIFRGLFSTSLLNDLYASCEHYGPFKLPQYHNRLRSSHGSQDSTRVKNTDPYRLSIPLQTGNPLNNHFSYTRVYTKSRFIKSTTTLHPSWSTKKRATSMNQTPTPFINHSHTSHSPTKPSRTRAGAQRIRQLHQSNHHPIPARWRTTRLTRGPRR